MASYQNETYVRALVTDRLLFIMATTPYRFIHISDVVRAAQVSRSSFYRNFKDKDDVIRQYLQRLTAEWWQDFDAQQDQDLSNCILRHFYMHRDFCLLIHRSALFWMVYDHIKKEICHVNKDTPVILAYQASTIAGAVVGWLNEWVLRGMKNSPEELEALDVIIQTANHFKFQELSLKL